MADEPAQAPYHPTAPAPPLPAADPSASAPEPVAPPAPPAVSTSRATPSPGGPPSHEEAPRPPAGGHGSVRAGGLLRRRLEQRRPRAGRQVPLRQQPGPAAAPRRRGVQVPAGTPQE